MARKYYMGVDIGSSSIKAVLIDDIGTVVESDYMKNLGITSSVQKLVQGFEGYEISSIGITGSGRAFGRILLDADLVKNEIIAHSTAALHYNPEVNTVFEIGGEDSKLIQAEDGVVTGFAMNTSCSSGTGTMVEAIAARMGVSIEEVSAMALGSKNNVSVAAKCGVFAQSTAVNKRNVGVPVEDILMGVCRAVVNNYFSILVRNNRLKGPYIFQGAVAWNGAVVKCFEEKVGEEIIIPEMPHLMGAFGMALLTKSYGIERPRKLDVTTDYDTRIRYGTKCSNECEIVELIKNGAVAGCVGNKCDKCVVVGGGEEVVTTGAEVKTDARTGGKHPAPLSPATV
ncbi:MAG: acyl-CoA dehydratase activase [Thermodesulfobacteriota bacterium]